MKECSAVSPETGLYMKYAFIVKVKNRPAYAFCDDLADVRTTWNCFHNEFPQANLCVHRIIVVADVDTQIMRRKEEAV